MTAFVAAIDRGSFSAAAGPLGLTPSGVSKLVSRLEARLGVTLVERTTRRLDLTPEGALYLEASRRILSEIAELETSVAEVRGRPQGTLHVNSGVAFAVHQLAPVLGEFQDRYPQVRLDLRITDQIVDLAAEGTDVAIRTGPVTDQRLHARRFGDIRRVICASPDYLSRAGIPRSPGDLREHCCINMLPSPGHALWPFHKGDGSIELIETRGPVNVDNAQGGLALALAGVGVIRLGDFVVADALRQGQLVPLLTDVHHVEPVPISLVFLPGRQRRPRLRAFIDFVVERFHTSPWRLPAHPDHAS